VIAGASGRLWFVLVAASLLVGACQMAARSTIETGPAGFRTFTTPRQNAGAVVTCPDFLAETPLDGKLEGSPDDSELVWLRLDDGRRVSIIWPHGFRPIFDGGSPALLNDQGRVVARNGDRVTLVQVRSEEHTGSHDDPYVAAGETFGECYPYVP
jgi:hypothetical protein